jgi:membrane-bound serine protease (ClpP class)
MSTAASTESLKGFSPWWRRAVVRTSLVLAGAMLATLVTRADAAAGRRAVVLEIDGAIGPAVAEYVVRELEATKSGDTGLVLLRMDTPGGLDISMREIIRAILASPVPVATYVAPSGARAASAGTYITYASAIAAMAPGTNLGAATPIQLGWLPLLPNEQPDQPGGSTGYQDNENAGKDKAGGALTPQPQDTGSRKIVNDAVAYIRSLAELHGRNADWATEAVRNAVSLPASEALKIQVIDVIADNVPDLLRKIDGRTVIVAGKPERLATAGLEVVTVAPDWRTRLLAVITNPNVAYLLMLVGAYGLIFELANPGAVLPGVIGGISLLVALFALNLLPVDYTGAALVLLGIALMVAEAFVGSFGLIGVGGIAAFAMGSIVMFHSNAPGFGLSLSLVAASTIVTSGLFILVLAMLLRSRRHRVITGGEAMLGAEGETVDWHGEEGRAGSKARFGAPVLPVPYIRGRASGSSAARISFSVSSRCDGSIRSRNREKEA